MSSNLIYQFRITLEDIEPLIWRQIQVSSNYSFWDLHVAIQDSMGWLDCHLHEFKIWKADDEKAFRIGFPDPDGFFEVAAGWEVPISDYFTESGSTVRYSYDFGDSWDHNVILEEILTKDPDLKYPRCIAGERACPPEDCGGVPGYYELLTALKSPRSKKGQLSIEWLKGHVKNYHPYKSEHFDPAKVEFWDPAERLRIALGE